MATVSGPLDPLPLKYAHPPYSILLDNSQVMALIMATELELELQSQRRARTRTVPDF